MPKQGKSKLPDTIYVYEEGDGNDKYLMAFDNYECCADMGEKKLVGIYKIKSTAHVSNVTILEEK